MTETNSDQFIIKNHTLTMIKYEHGLGHGYHVEPCKYFLISFPVLGKSSRLLIHGCE